MRRGSLVVPALAAAILAMDAGAGLLRPPVHGSPPVRAVRCAGAASCRATLPAPRAVLHPATHQPGTNTPQPLPSPTAKSPLTILSVGDSLGEDLGLGLASLLAADAHVRVVQDAVGSTGLANEAYYNWAAHLAVDMAATHPQIVAVMVGGNDAVGFDVGSVAVAFGTSAWRRAYGGRVAALVQEALKAHARVVWVGMPVMAAGSVLSNAEMATLDAVYQRETTGRRDVTYVSTWALFQGPRGGFTPELRDQAGTLETVRDPDGVHIAPMAGDELVASAVLDAIDRAEGLQLCPAATDPWRRFVPKACGGTKSGQGR